MRGCSGGLISEIKLQDITRQLNEEARRREEAERKCLEMRDALEAERKSLEFQAPDSRSVSYQYLTS
jgi:hypothetical protein